MIRDFVRNKLLGTRARQTFIAGGAIAMLLAFPEMPVNGKKVMPLPGGGWACVLMMASAGFTQTLHVYTSGTSATETIPNGAVNCEIEAWGGGGGSGGTSGTGPFVAGGGSASGSYSRCTISVGSQNGKTFTYTVGTFGVGGVANTNNGQAGATTTVVAGTITGFNSISCPGGGGGVSGGAGTGGTAGGVPTNTNAGAVNTNGNPGGAGGGSGGAGGSPGTGISGNVSGDGSPYGAGSGGHSGSVSGNGFSGNAGAVVFFYT